MKRFDFHEDYAAPQINGTTIEAKIICVKRGDRKVTVEFTSLDSDGGFLCDQEVEFTSVEFAKFCRTGLEAVKCAGAFDTPKLEVVG